MFNTIKKYVPSIILIVLSAIFVANLTINDDGDSVGLLFPKLISIILLICGVLLAFRTYAKIRVKNRSGNTDDDVNQERVYLPLLIVLVGYIILMNIVGFFISTPIFLYACCRVFNIKKLFSVIFSLVATGIIYVLFIQILFVPFPDGVWIFKDLSNFIMY